MNVIIKRILIIFWFDWLTLSYKKPILKGTTAIIKRIVNI